MASHPLLRIGTRGSPLALAQARELKSRLESAHAVLAGAGAVEITVIKTSGDLFTDRPLADIGGKGLFTKEIEDALLAEKIDVAVHSMKDVPTFLPDGLILDCYLPREDARDVFFSPLGPSIESLPPRAKLGSASLRRAAQALHRRPDLEIVSLRGNVETRLRKLESGEAAATFLALAGLKRLGLGSRAQTVLSMDDMLPAVGQGAIGLECRLRDDKTRGFLAALNHAPTQICVEVERAFLAALDGSCRTPIAAHAEMRQDGRMRFRGLIARPDGRDLQRIDLVLEASAAAQASREAGAKLKRNAPPGFFAGP